MSFSVHRPGRFGSDGRIEFEVDGESREDLYLDDVRAAQAGERSDASDGDGPVDPFPETDDLLEDALAMNPPLPAADTVTDAAPPVIGEWGAVDEPSVDEPSAEAAPVLAG